VRTCDWCGQTLPAESDRRRRYCSLACRRDAGHYVEFLPRWQARLAELEEAAAGWRKVRQTFPVFLRNEIDALRRNIDRPPKVTP
jgi:hypothetical protein